MNLIIVYLDLRFGHAQSVRQFGPFGTGQVLGLLERFLQCENLLATERRPGVLLFTVLISGIIGIVRYYQDKQKIL